MKYIFLLLFTMLLMGTSCKKFLAARSQSEMTPTTTEDYSELLFGSGYPLSTMTFAQQILFMDDDVQAYCNDNSYQNAQQYTQPLPAFSWQPDFYDRMTTNGYGAGAMALDSYKNFYSMISGANIAIKYADSSAGSQADKDYLKGQGFALRAYYYLMLVNLYGRPYNDSTTSPDKSPGVPLLTSPDLKETMPARNSVGEVYAQIFKDLDSAAGRLDGAKRSGDIYRINHIAAHLLASRAYLYTGAWDSVIRHASYVIGYQPNLIDLNAWGLSSGWYYGVTPFQPIVTGNVETIWSYGSTRENYAFTYTGYCYDVSADLVNQYQPDDLRSQIYFSAVPSFLQAYIIPAYVGQKVNSDNTTSNSITACSFRTSEAYLNRAEAYAEKFILTGDPSAQQNALKDLNTLRVRRIDQASYQPLGPMPADSLLQFCRNERRRELFQEGYHRWFDLRRYGMPAITHYYATIPGTTARYVLNAHDPQYTLPIPSDAMLLNTNLIQNPLGPQRQPSN